MDECYKCDIEYKVQYCCGSHPETGEMVALRIGREIFQACPELNESGDCTVHENRPDPCEKYECPKLNQIDLLDRIQSNSL